MKRVSSFTPPPTGHLLLFFGLALGWSWAFWFLAIGLDLSLASPGGLVLGLLGLLGPMLAGISCTWITRGREGLREFRLRLTDPKRIRARWYAVIFLSVPALMAASVLLDVLSGGTGGFWEESALELAAAPWKVIPFALGIFLVGPMEEFGWRGYGLDRLQERWNALTSGLVLGAVWSLWHLPLFFIRDSYQYNLGAGSLSFWLFMTGIVPLSVIFSWIHNNTERSILAAMLFHFMVNFTGELVGLTTRGEIYSILLWFVAAAAVTVKDGPRTLVRGKDPRRLSRG